MDSSLYRLSFVSFSVSTELFSDCFSESGVIKQCCSDKEADFVFGSRGTWESSKKHAESGCCIPPLDLVLITGIIEAFDKGVWYNRLETENELS